VLAADNARFALPELSLATIPGAGGTQRLTRAIGKSKAMEMVLGGRQLDADEADRFGLVSRVVPLAGLRAEALAVAAKIAAQSLPATMMAKECVNRAFEGTLAEGVQFERRMAYATFACADHKEGLAAFIEKRPPVFQHK